MNSQKMQKCPFCNHYILQHNMETHQAHCERLSQKKHSVLSQESPISVPSQDSNQFSERERLRALYYQNQNNQQEDTEEKKFNESYIQDSDLIPCPNCYNQIELSQIEDHLKVCDQIEIECQYCHGFFPKNLMDIHQTEYCVLSDRKISNSRQQEEEQKRNIQNQQQQYQQDFRQQNLSSSRHNRNREQSDIHIRQSLRNYGINNDNNLDSNQEIQIITNPDGSVTKIIKTQGGTQIITTRNNGSQQQSQSIYQSGSSIFDSQSNSLPNLNIFMGQQQQQQLPNQQLSNLQQHIQQMFIPQIINPNRRRGPRLVPNNGEMPQFHQQQDFDNFFNILLGLQVHSGLNSDELNNFETHKFHKTAGMSEEALKCPICLCDFEEEEDVKFLICFHKFHSECIDKWLEGHTNCPVCKKEQK